MRSLSRHVCPAFVFAYLVLLTVAAFADSAEGVPDARQAPVGSRLVVTLTTGGRFVGTSEGVRDGRLVLDLTRPGERGTRRMEIPVERIEAIEIVSRARPGAEPVRTVPAGRRAQAPRTQPAGAGPLAATRPASADEAAQDVEQSVEAQLALLEEFPPAQGWSIQRWRQLGERIYLRNMHPSPREKRFMEILPGWLRGVAHNARRERGEDLAEPFAGPSGTALLTRFPPEKPADEGEDDAVWSDQRYVQLRERLFVESFELWLSGRQLAGQGADPASLSADGRDAISFYVSYPEEHGWGDARYGALASKHGASVTLTDDERAFVALYPNWKFAQAASVAAEHRRREPTISYDNMSEFKYDRDMPDENVSSENVRRGSLSNDNVVPVTRGEEK